MATTRATRPERRLAGRKAMPARKSVAGTSVTGTKPKTASATSPKRVEQGRPRPGERTGGGPTRPAPTISPAQRRQAKAKRDAEVARRAAAKLTKSKTLICGDIGDAVADPGDTVARAAIAAKARSPSKKPRNKPSKIRSAVDRLNDPPPATGLPLIDRVATAIERELTQIERIVGGHRVEPEQRTEAERRARTLASLARTLAAVRKLRADEEHKNPPDDDAIPRDLDELRCALSRRLEQMVASAAELPAAGDE